MSPAYQALPQWIAGNIDAKRSALYHGSRSLDYGTLLALVAASVSHMRSSGVSRGDRVLVLAENSIEHVVAVLSITAMGAIAIPVDPSVGPVRLARIVRETQPTLVLTAGRARKLDDIECMEFHADTDRISVAFGEAVHSCGVGDALPDPPGPDDAALIRYTSGSSGEPKGVLLSHHQMVWMAGTLSRIFSIDADHRELILAPMTHSGAWQRVAATLFAGGCVVINDELLSVPGLLESVAEHRATGWFAPPPVIRMLLRVAPERVRPALSSCRSIEIGSGPIGPDELADMRDRCPDARLFLHYGLTECSRAFVLDTRGQGDSLHTVGLPAPGVALEIRDDQGKPLPCGQMGEIHLRGPQVARWYWQRGGELREVTLDGWLATGDLGSVDPRGFLQVRGRRDDRICSGGHSFFPAEVEAELGRVDDVRDYLVVGMRDEGGMLGEEPWAFVVPERPDTWSAGSFLARARAALPPYMVPRRVLAVNELPRTASGKPDRLELRRQHARG